jgi:hypothetical protein
MQNPNLFYYNPASIAPSNEVLDVDVCIYGGNAAGVIAALQAHKFGLKAVLLEPSGHIGGLTTGGLSYTDFGSKTAIGGLSREFYRRCGQHYGVEEEWKFEPKVATKVLQGLLDEAQTPLYFRQFVQSVEKSGNRITQIGLEGGLKVRAKIFIDCSYEGDLMGRAGVTYHVGRESNQTFDETLNGIQVHNKHQFDFPVDPYVEEGNAASGLLPGIDAEHPLNFGDAQGEGDHRVQAYNFRMCLSKDPNNQKPFAKPEGYNAAEYVLLARYLAKGWQQAFHKFDPIRGDKCDMNNHGGISTDFIGRNHDFPEGSYQRREQIFQEHVTYQMGLLWFRANDPSVPQWVRDQQAQWQLPLDEFVETGGWPHQLYIREARRMMGDYVMTQNDCQAKRRCDDAIGMASYTMDSHNCARWLKKEGDSVRVMNEGDVQVPVKPYPVSLRSIMPRQAECDNLIVPVCLSSSHIAYGSIRMEPVFMLLAQSAATLAALALQGAQTAVQEVPYTQLREQLLKDGQVLEQ